MTTNMIGVSNREMKNRLTTACSTPSFFSSFDSSRPGMETRTVLLAEYSDGGMPEAQAARVHKHLEKCEGCARFLEELELPGEPQIAFAVCPSSDSLDRLVFERGSLNPEAAGRIENHLSLCPLCRKETDWLKELENPQVLAFEAPAWRWNQPALAVAAVLLIALGAMLFWRSGGTAVPNDQSLRALAVIKEPAEIDYAELDLTSKTLDEETKNHYVQAVSDFKAARYQQASVRFEQVLKAAPGHSGATYLLGYSYYKMNQPEKAFALCDQAEGMKPHAYERCMFLVNIALKTGNFRRAFTEISTLYHDAPEVPEVRDMYRKITALMPDTKKI